MYALVYDIFWKDEEDTQEEVLLRGVNADENNSRSIKKLLEKTCGKPVDEFVYILINDEDAKDVVR